MDQSERSKSNGGALLRVLFVVLCSAMLLFVMEIQAQAQSMPTHHVRRGKALTALLRMLLLSVAAVFEGVSKVFLYMDNSIEQDARDAERAQQKSSQVCTITFSALPGGKRSPLDEAFAHNSAPALTATAAGRGHHG